VVGADCATSASDLATERAADCPARTCHPRMGYTAGRTPVLRGRRARGMRPPTEPIRTYSFHILLGIQPPHS
jgi:hypothetical protein